MFAKDFNRMMQKVKLRTKVLWVIGLAGGLVLAAFGLVVLYAACHFLQKFW